MPSVLPPVLPAVSAARDVGMIQSPTIVSLVFPLVSHPDLVLSASLDQTRILFEWAAEFRTSTNSTVGQSSPADV